MKAMVKKNGLLIPKKFLKGIKEAKIQWEKDKLVILPIKREEKDPILELGSHPGHSGLKRGSMDHDSTIYNGV